MAIRFFRPREDVLEVVDRIYVHESATPDILTGRWLIVPDGEIKVIFSFEATFSVGLVVPSGFIVPAASSCRECELSPARWAFRTGWEPSAWF